MNKMDEMIIVAPRKVVFKDEGLSFQGTLQNEDLVEEILENIGSSYEIMRRGNAEENEKFKQPIPYAVIKRGNEVFIYERLQGGGEKRLHSKLSLGVGGHMNSDLTVSNFHDLLLTNLRRELEEELIISETSEPPELKIIGIINDESNEVGKVHIGILVVIEVSEDTEIEIREVEELRGNWLKIPALKNKILYGKLENWSKIVADIP